MSESSITLHHEATSKRSKRLQLVALAVAVPGVWTFSLPLLGAALVLALVARGLNWWDHG